VCVWDAHSALGDFALHDSQEYFIEKDCCIGHVSRKLHNFCINERESIISPMIANDEANIELEGAVPLQSYNSNTPEGMNEHYIPPELLIG
jgi:hypothetical protein